MAHYDCSNCGASMGIGFGYCGECTPKEYFEIQEEIKELNRKAEHYVEQHFKEMRERLKQKWLGETNVAELQNKLKEMEDAEKRKDAILRATHFILIKETTVFVKEAQFFKDQGGLEKEWGKSWEPVRSASIENARAYGETLRKRRNQGD